MKSTQIGLLATALIATATPSFAQSRPDLLANPNHPLWGIVSDVVRGVVEAKARREQQPPTWQATMDLPPASRNPGTYADAAQLPPARQSGLRAPGTSLTRAK